MLMLPNIIWSKNKPKGYDKYVKNENKVLLLLEWLGEMLVTCLSLIFSDFNINKISNWSSILLIAFIIMILYEIYWIRYFKSNKTMKDMYSSLLGIPVAGATLPVVAFLLLGIYGRNIFLIKNSKFLKPLILQGISPAQCSVFMYFPLFLPLRAETRATFYSPPTTLSSSLAEVRFASLVE